MSNKYSVLWHTLSVGFISVADDSLSRKIVLVVKNNKGMGGKDIRG